jgi:hypothetical protein
MIAFAKLRALVEGTKIVREELLSDRLAGSPDGRAKQAAEAGVPA